MSTYRHIKTVIHKQHNIDNTKQYNIDNIKQSDYIIRKNDLLEQFNKLKKDNYIDKSSPYIYFILVHSINNNFDEYVKCGIAHDDIESRLLIIFNNFCPMEYITILCLIRIDNPMKYEKKFHRENSNIKLKNINSGNFEKSRESYPYQIGCNKFIFYYINHIKPYITNIENNVYFNMNNQYIDQYFKLFNKSKIETIYIDDNDIINDKLNEENNNYINKVSIDMNCKIYIEIKKHFNWVDCKIIDIRNVRKRDDIKKIKVILDDKTLKYNEMYFNIENITYDIMWKII
jgi:hypothetical protein